MNSRPCRSTFPPILAVRAAGGMASPAHPLLVVAALLALAGCSSGGGGGSSPGGDNPGSGDPVLTLSASPTHTEIDVSWNADDFPDADRFNLCWAGSELNGFDSCGAGVAASGGNLEQDLDRGSHVLEDLDSNRPYYLMLEAEYDDGDPMYSRQIAVVTSQRFNDTGIDWCVDGRNERVDCPAEGDEGQDAEHGRDALAANGGLEKVGDGAAGFDYTRICGDGEPEGSGNCPDGLKTEDIGAGAREWACTRDNVTGRMWEVRADYARFEWTGVGAYSALVNGQGLCGYDDWRVPAVDELYSLTHLGERNPAIDRDYFPNTPNGSFWSATRAAHSLGFAWYVDFGSGWERISRVDTEHYVRLVRDAW